MLPPRIPLHHLFADYRANRYREELLTDWGSALLYRPAGIVIAWLLVGTRVTPNAVTGAGAGLLVLMIAAILIAPATTALAAVLALSLIYLVLDCTDGTLARAKGHVSVSGHYWDLVADQIYRGVVYMSVGYLVDNLAPWTLPVSQTACLACAAWLASLARVARNNLNRLAPVESLPPKRGEGFTLFSFLSGIDTLFPLLVVLAWSLGIFHLLVAWLLLFSLGDAIAALFEARNRLNYRQG